MDGKNIQVADKLYDINYGGGEVVAVGETVVVQFAKVKQSYDLHGRSLQWKRKTLYWAEPLIIVPTPITALNQLINDAVSNINSTVRLVWSNANGKT